MLFLGITLTGWTMIVIALAMAVLAGIMFMLGTKRTHYLWGVFSVATAIWAAGFYLVTLSETPTEAIFWWKVSFVGIIFVPFTFFHFVIEFINVAWLNRIKPILLIVLYLICATFLVLNVGTNLMVNDVTFLFNELYYNVPPGVLHPYFTGLYGILVLFAFYLIGKEYIQRPFDIEFRRQAIYFILGTVIGISGASMDFFLVYGIEIHPIRNLLVVVGSFIVAFAILRHRLFNVRIVTAQFLTFLIAAVATVRLFISGSVQEVVFNLAMLIITVVVGTYLIASVRREVEQREEIQRLYKELEIKNVRLTELDKLKSQFLSIATHELRTPLTIVRNFISLMLDGSYGKVPPAIEEGGRQVFSRVTDMARSVDTYLNVSRIEQGKMKYDFIDANLTKVVQQAVEAMKPNAEKKKLTLNLEIKRGAEDLVAHVDGAKVTEVITNLLDNSIKYTPEGSIQAILEKVGNKARLTIQDTGVGMSPETMAGLFKLFSPGEDSKKINPASTGVGLYISKAHIEAHNGTLTAASQGVGKGSQFVIELPIVK